MGLRINTNVAAINTSRVLRRSTEALNKSLQRLSSGLRINGAADDAAGLAIAEGFNSMVRGAAVAQRNAQDGVSMVQTAEG
ncbi:MAG TPA: flagellin FliC, partial [Candidatus Hydrogenedentes bacterium]|nr:flagellin FliC [Candidatus Hydrogenedentota bacterium]